MAKLKNIEVNSIVSYIGVQNGYLGDFSYATHAAFYPDYCGLDIDPSMYNGTTRERFITIISEASPSDQSKILEGVLEKYPIEYFEDLSQEKIISVNEYQKKIRTYKKINEWINKLDGEIIEQGELRNDFEFVKKVLDQSEILISNHSYGSAVDRVHTAIHGYLKALCDGENIIFNEQNVKIQDMWGRLKVEHTSFNIEIKEHQRPINQTAAAIGKILENMNEVRNRHGFSHPNDDIIEEDEARFIVNLSRVLLFYIDSKTSDNS